MIELEKFVQLLEELKDEEAYEEISKYAFIIKPNTKPMDNFTEELDYLYKDDGKEFYIHECININELAVPGVYAFSGILFNRKSEKRKSEDIYCFFPITEEGVKNLEEIKTAFETWENIFLKYNEDSKMEEKENPK